VYRATTQGGPFTLVATTGPNIESYTNTGLTRNKPYIYKIRAVKGGGASLYTDELVVSTYNQIVLVNLNSNAAGGHLQAPTPPWNNTATPPAAGLIFSNFKDDANAITSVDLEILSWGTGGTNNTGYITGSNSGIYPDAVLENYYYFEQFEAPTTYRLTGLNSAYLYDLVFLGNEWTAATINNLVVATDYTVGSRTVSQFNGKNTTSTVAIKGIVPSSAIIPFEIKANDAARYGVWNAIEIRSYAPIPETFNARLASSEDVLTEEAVVSMYPNPVEDRLKIMIHDEAVDGVAVGVNVISALGVRMVADEMIHGREGIEIDTSHFSAGVYILKLNVNGRTVIRRFIKK
jgi:large repetitive protein